MPRKHSIRVWDDTDESHNFILNARTAMKGLGLGITEVEERASTKSGYTSMLIKRKGPISLILAARIAHQVGFSLDDLIKPPAEFQQILNTEMEGDNTNGR